MRLVEVLLGCGGLGGLLIIGSVILAQDTGSEGTGVEEQATAATSDASAPVAANRMTWKQAKDLVAPLREQAGLAFQQGDNATAAAKYCEIAASLPRSPVAANAWLAASSAYLRMGKVAEGKAACDSAVSICKNLMAVDQSIPHDSRQEYSEICYVGPFITRPCSIRTPGRTRKP